MKNYFVSTHVTIYFVVANVTDAVHKLVAVTPLAGSEMDFLRVKMSSPLSSYEYNEEEGEGQPKEFEFSTTSPPDAKDQSSSRVAGLTAEYDYQARNCSHVFDTPLFDMRDEEVLDFRQTDVQDELKDNHEGLFREIVENGNPYIQRVVLVDNIFFTEWTFRCLTRKRKGSRAFVQYFLSPIYNVNESKAANAEKTIIRGRFVFSSSSETNGLKVFALAEEPPAVDDKVIHRTHEAYYYAKNNTDLVEPTMNSNSVCGMSETQKIRLCALVFSSDKFWGKSMFFPSKDYIEPDCQMEQVFARVKVNTQGVKNLFYRTQVFDEIDIMYNEWMMGCKGVYSERDRDVLSPSIYVSRGYEVHTAIVYKRMPQNVYVAAVGLSNVSVITEKGVIRSISENPVVPKRSNRIVRDTGVSQSYRYTFPF